IQKMQPHNVFTLFYAVLKSLFVYLFGNVMMLPRPMGREIKTSHPELNL
uniref:Uncharacterized protein n=1 Tax=Nomascus leucogenys TaxID=61853 RepID=A0A2I3G8M7_NOMLE